MSFEEFEQILMACGQVIPLEGAAEHGSDDFEVRLWRCYGNDNCCSVHHLYEAINKTIEAEKAKARLEGERDALLELIWEGRGRCSAKEE